MKAKILASLLLAASSLPAMASSQWNIQFFLDPGLLPAAIQGICFLDNGTWFSTTFPNWKGDWEDKDDRFRFYGRTGGTLATGEFGQRFSVGFIAGEFAHWIAIGTSNPPLTSSRGSWKMVRIGECTSPPLSGPAPAGKDPAAK